MPQDKPIKVDPEKDKPSILQWLIGTTAEDNAKARMKREKEQEDLKRVRNTLQQVIKGGKVVKKVIDDSKK